MSSRNPFSSSRAFPEYQPLPSPPGIPNLIYSPAILLPVSSDLTLTGSNTPMDSGQSTTSGRDQSFFGEKRATHIRRSCEICRASKGRCCPSVEDPTRCQKCVKDGKTCVFLEARQRPKRMKTSKSRVAEMEQRLDGIFALLASRGNPNSGKELSVPITPPRISFPSFGQHEPFAFQRPQSAMRSTTPTWMSSYLSRPKFDGVQDVISRGLIGIDKAENFLRDFNTNACNFPFVFVDPQISLNSMRCENPFLLLCILTMSANNDISLQKLLEMEVRETLARKLIINCEKSLDILQGLLIYVSWYHRYFDPKREQIYQLTQMVIAMAVDLGITVPDTNMHQRLHSYEIPNRTNHGQAASKLEEKRTFLGCYYLSSCLSFAFRKPSNLKYTDYVDACCQALNQAREAPLDHWLQYLIQLQRLVEEVNSTFDYDNYQQLPVLDAVRIEMLVTLFNKQLSQLEETFPKDVLDNIVVQMSILHIRIYIHEIGLHAIKPKCAESSFGKRGYSDWYSSVARNDIVLSCVAATKKYLDRYLMQSKHEMQRNTMLQEINLIYAVLIIGRFTTGVDSPFLDAAYLRETANFNYYMSALVDHMSKLIIYTSDGKEQLDMFWHFRRIFQYTKNWSLEQTKNGGFTTLDLCEGQDCLNLSFLEILQMEADPQYAYGTLCPPELTISEDEMWAEVMQDTWPIPTDDPGPFSANVNFQKP